MTTGEPLLHDYRPSITSPEGAGNCLRFAKSGVRASESHSGRAVSGTGPPAMHAKMFQGPTKTHDCDGDDDQLMVNMMVDDNADLMKLSGPIGEDDGYWNIVCAFVVFGQRRCFISRPQIP